MKTTGKHTGPKKQESQPTTIADVEQETGVKFDVAPETTLKKYFVDHGVPGLAQILEKVEKNAQA